MREILALGRNDLRNILRERILIIIFLITPLGYLVFSMYTIPWLASIYPIIEEYYPILFFLIAAQLGGAFGFVTANIILDEKDQEVLQAIKVLPLSAGSFLGFRFILPTAIAFVFTILLIQLANIMPLSATQSLQCAVLFATVAPQIALAMTILGGNKVEGLAIFKLLNLIVILPAVGIFLPGNWGYVLSIIPSYWIYYWILDAEATGLFWLALAIQLLFLWYLMVLFRKRVF